MKRVVLALWWVCSVPGCGQEKAAVETVEQRDERLARALAGGEEGAQAIAELRERGREGLRQLLAAYRERVGEEDDAQWERVIDAVAGQLDARTSELFWETDLDHAQAQARARGVPVLSLRMLGNLTDALSCANSRFFRTLLYSDPELARFLDEGFVLHWSSERPVPTVTIDFGDGRTMTTTTTGNSAHYVLDADGRVLDVLPGLYDPGTFRARLQDAIALHDAITNAPERRDALVREHHARAAAAIEARWAGVDPAIEAWMRRAPGRTTDAPVPALEAQPIAIAKSRAETPTLRGMEGTDGPMPPEPSRDALARLAAPVELSPQAIAIIERDRPIRFGETAEQHARRIAAVVRTTAQDLALDTFVNEARLHFQIHRWFAGGEIDGAFEAVNERVYRELFGTPRSDPWLGLRDDASYDGLREGPYRLEG